CEYHIVWVPKYRFPILEGEINRILEEDKKLLCEWKKCEIQEMSVQCDHIHLVLSIPPKVSVSEMMGILKGKLAIKLFKSYPKMKQKPYWGNHFWARGYFVSTVGIDEDVIKRYVKHQEEEEKRIEEQQHRFDF
ncbi:MAG: IS200/IS605 family transposase, partial [Thermodesulfobacteriota bacterium]|nr:IS200/IS605 family transposase [Thermodesulfobacteriota bacterium]